MNQGVCQGRLRPFTRLSVSLRPHLDVFNLDPRTGLFASRIKNIRIEKSPDGAFGGWKLKALELIVNGKTVFQNNAIDKWLEDDDRIFSAPV